MINAHAVTTMTVRGLAADNASAYSGEKLCLRG